MSNILALVYVECHCGERQPLQLTRPRSIDQTACGKWLRERGWSFYNAATWQCPDCTAKDRAKRAAKKASA